MHVVARPGVASARKTSVDVKSTAWLGWRCCAARGTSESLVAIVRVLRGLNTVVHVGVLICSVVLVVVV